MIRKVLIVDDNQEMLFTLKNGLERHRDFFKVLISGDGFDAISKLKNNTISLVVTDVKMPRMDGVSLMNHIIETYPGIPLILISSHMTIELKKMLQRPGVAEYLEKPFHVEQLTKKIISVLRRQTNGGTLQNVSTSMFLQLMEMEQKTCTIRLECVETGRNGILFFKRGKLLDARVRSKKAIDAAYEIFSWETVNLSIENNCPLAEDQIKKDVQSIYLESLHRKDEAAAAQPQTAKAQNTQTRMPKQSPQPRSAKGQQTQQMRAIKAQPTQARSVPNHSSPKTRSVQLEKPIPSLKNKQIRNDSIEKNGTNDLKEKAEKIKKYLFDKVGARCGLENIYPDNSWEGVIAQMELLGNTMGAGELEVAYIRNGDEVDYVVIPETEPLLLVMNSKCPRDRVLKALMNKKDF